MNQRVPTTPSDRHLLAVSGCPNSGIWPTLDVRYRREIILCSGRLRLDPSRDEADLAGSTNHPKSRRWVKIGLTIAAEHKGEITD